MKKANFIFLISMFPILSIAQTPLLDWAAQMGGTSTDNGGSITVDAAGNVLTTGSFFETVDFDPGAGTFNLTSAGSGDIFISKLDNMGNFVWAKQMGGSAIDDGRSIVVDGSGNIYITGRFGGTADFDPGAGTFNLTSVGQDDIYIAKLDASGNFLWAKQMGGTSFDIGQSIVLDDSGNLISAGYFFGTVDFDPGAGTFNLTAAGSHDIYITKLDAAGNFLWAKQMGGTNIDFGIALDLDGSGNIYTTGHFRETADFDPGAGTFNLTSAGDQDIYISKLDALGNFVWAKQMGGTEIDGAQNIDVDDAGNVFTTGYFKGTADFDPGAGTFNFTSAGDSDIFISKLDASGNFVWAKQLGSVGYDEALSIKVDPISGAVFFAGGFTETVDFDPGAGTYNLTSNGDLDMFISQLDSSGDFVWAIQMGSSKSDDCLSITLDNASNIHSTGYFQETVDFDPGTPTFDLTSEGGFDIFIQKLRTTPVGIAENNFKNEFNIYPNPTNGEVNLDFGSINNASIKVLSLDGRIVYENNTSSNFEHFEINGSPGIYFVEILTQSDKKVFKLVKL